MGADDETAQLLDEARRAREGRDLWRAVGPTLVKLRARKVSYRQIREATGIEQGTVGSVIKKSRTTGSTDSSDLTS